MIQTASDIHTQVVRSEIQRITTIPLKLGRISGWRAQYTQIHLKTRIGVNIGMPVHSIVNAGSPAMM